METPETKLETEETNGDSMQRLLETEETNGNSRDYWWLSDQWRLKRLLETEETNGDSRDYSIDTKEINGNQWRLQKLYWRLKRPMETPETTPCILKRSMETNGDFRDYWRLKRPIETPETTGY